MSYTPSVDKKGGINFNDKVIFIVGFVALIIAFSSSKSWADNVPINIIFYTYSLTQLVVGFLILLLTSIYLYALNYIRYDYEWLLEIKQLKYIEDFADGIYSFAIAVYPILILLLWAIHLLLSQLSVRPSILLSSLSLAASTVVSVIAFFGGFAASNRKNKILVEDLQEQEKKLSIFSERFYKKKDYKLSILNLFNSLIKFVQSNLIKAYGPDIARLPSGALIRLAQKDGLLKPEDAAFINDLRGVRNLIAHSELPALDEKSARKYLDRGSLILKKFDMAQHMPKDPN